MIFLVEDACEGGWSARALGASIYTEADTEVELHERVRDAVRCHFDEGDTPHIIRLRVVREDVIALADVAQHAGVRIDDAASPLWG